MMVARLIEQIREIGGRTVCVVFSGPPLSQMSKTVRLSRPSEMMRLEGDRLGLSVHGLSLHGNDCSVCWGVGGKSSDRASIADRPDNSAVRATFQSA